MDSVLDSEGRYKESGSSEHDDIMNKNIAKYRELENLVLEELDIKFDGDMKETKLLSPSTQTDNLCLSPVAIVDHKTPHSHKHKPVSRKSKRRSNAVDVTPPKTRQTPLPLLHWADSTEVWQNMIYKEEVALVYRNSRLFENRDSFLPRVRAILLDWIMEVCEVYKLRRVTYYLAVDYIDRYLTIRPDVPKTQLQLIGVTCLFIASKLEEVYPPKLSEFSYVCDGACTDSEILSCELLILNNLGWDVNPITPSGWLNLYMQIHCDAEKVIKQKLHDEVSRNFFFPQYSGFQFVKASQIIDLFSLDPGFLQFSYSVIAAAAVYFILGKQTALRVSGLCWDQLKYCVEYMAVFNKVIRDSVDPNLNSMPMQDTDSQNSNRSAHRALKVAIPDLIVDENHSMQTHCIDLDYFERAVMLRLEQMGLKVQKTVIKKKKDLIDEGKDDEKENTDNENEKTVEKNEGVTIVYEIEKVNMEKSICPEEEEEKSDFDKCDLNATPVEGDLSIFSVEKRMTFTFDHILYDINDEFTKKLVPKCALLNSEDESEV